MKDYKRTCFFLEAYKLAQLFWTGYGSQCWYSSEALVYGIMASSF